MWVGGCVSGVSLRGVVDRSSRRRVARAEADWAEACFESTHNTTINRALAIKGAVVRV